MRRVESIDEIVEYSALELIEQAIAWLTKDEPEPDPINIRAAIARNCLLEAKEKLCR